MSAVVAPFPAENLARVGGSSDIGSIVVEMFQEICALTPTERVLDIGCGIGRIAVPLTKALHTPGSYEGFDPSADSIQWCQENITKHFPHFRFVHADLYCPLGNPSGPKTAKSFRFPYESNSFDFVFANSIFTHLTGAEVKQCLREIARVLKTGGRCYMTFFLDPENKDAVVRLPERNVPLSAFFQSKHCKLLDPNIPEAFVVHSEKHIRKICRWSGLLVQEPVLRGMWCRATPNHDFADCYQDIVVAEKKWNALSVVWKPLQNMFRRMGLDV